MRLLIKIPGAFWDDPDAPGGDFVHWLVFNIPPETSDVGLGQTPKGIVGKNSSNQNNYAPPCPPTGSHRYFFKLFAIKTKLELDNTVTKNEILARLEGNILAQAELVGLYEQSRSNLLNP